MRVGLCRLLLEAYGASRYMCIPDDRVLSNLGGLRSRVVGFLYQLSCCLELFLDELQEEVLSGLAEETAEDDWDEALEAAE